jgi:phage shock protein A
MSIFEKLSHTFRGVVNDALDKSADAGRDARQIVRDLEEQIGKVEQAMLDVRAENEVLKQKRDKQQTEVDKWVTASTKAVNAGDDGLARECLTKKAAAVTLLQSYKDQLAKFEPTVQQLNQHLLDLRAKKNELADRTDLIAARSEMADAQTKAATAMSGIGGGSLISDFDKLEEQVAKKEARATAATNMSDEISGKSLDDRVAALGNTSINDELAAMKAARLQ